MVLRPDFSPQRLSFRNRCDCFATAVKQSILSKHSVVYYCEEEVLMRKWSPPKAEEDWNTVFQVVVPEPYLIKCCT